MHFLGLLLTQALALYQRGDWDRSDGICTEVLKASPGNFDALHLKGVLAADRGDFVASIEFLRQALVTDRLNAAAYLHMGNSLRRLRRHEEAIANYDSALNLNPAFVQAWNNRGNALREMGRHADAIESLQKALVLHPDDAEILNNLGNVYKDLHCLEEALNCYDRAIALTSDYAEAHNNRGFVLTALRRPLEALTSYEKAQNIYPSYARAHLNEALCRLLIGDYATGWAKYEWRWADIQRTEQRTFTQPRWQGDVSLNGKTILVHREQGFGDCIQFSRYVPRLATSGARVILEAPIELTSLLASIPGVDAVVSGDLDKQDFDYHCPLASLPLAFASSTLTIPAQVPYVTPPKERVAYWRNRLGPARAKRVGIAWSGSNTDPLRTIRLEHFLHIASPEYEWFSVQKSVPEHDIQAVENSCAIVHLGNDLHDFGDTAAVLSLMDVIVSIDTSVAHLAGALGKPSLVLLHAAADWRYGLHTDVCVWYPTMRLFRQKKAGEWLPVLEEVKLCLTGHSTLQTNN